MSEATVHFGPFSRIEMRFHSWFGRFFPPYFTEVRVEPLVSLAMPDRGIAGAVTRSLLAVAWAGALIVAMAARARAGSTLRRTAMDSRIPVTLPTATDTPASLRLVHLPDHVVQRVQFALGHPPHL